MFEAKKYDLNRDRSQKLLECGDYFTSTGGKRSANTAQTLPAMTDEHIFAVARPERLIIETAFGIKNYTFVVILIIKIDNYSVETWKAMDKRLIALSLNKRWVALSKLAGLLVTILWFTSASLNRG
jgi:hypothetical protein